MFRLWRKPLERLRHRQKAPRGRKGGWSCRHQLKKVCARCSRSAELSRPPRSSAAKPMPAIPPSMITPCAIPWFSGQQARKLDWFTPWQKVLDWNLPSAKWFVGGKLNVAYNCVDRHARSARRNKAAIIWEGRAGRFTRLTYGVLEREVNRFANALRSLGVTKGDRVAVYMGMVPELAIAMLACAKIGAPHSIVFGGFPPKPCASASTTPKPKWWSPAMAPGAAAASCP